MKNFPLIFTLAFFSFLTVSGRSEQTNEIVIGLSPFQTPIENGKQQALLQNFLLKDCPNGCHVLAMDAWNLNCIFDIQLPKLTYDSPMARAPILASGLNALHRWFTETKSTTPLKCTGAIKIPQFFETVAARSTSYRAIVIFASPFCLVPDEPTFSMIDSRFPSDGNLSRTTSQSVYGISDKRGHLTNTAVLWAFPSENIWASAFHRDRTMRFWCLFIGGQNGMLAKFCGDPAQTLLSATTQQHQAVGNFILNPEDNGMIMHVAAKREVPVDSQQQPPDPPKLSPHTVKSNPPPVKVPIAPLVKLSPTPKPLSSSKSESVPVPQQMAQAASNISIPKEIPIPATDDMGIAAVWHADAEADIDLWVAAKAGLPEAYWNKPHVTRVNHFRDIRESQAAENTEWLTAWEYVLVEQAQIEEPTVWLNVYAATGPVHGIVRVQFRGRVVDIPFKFDVTRGNKGHDSKLSDRVCSPYWQQLNLSAFFPASSKLDSEISPKPNKKP